MDSMSVFTDNLFSFARMLGANLGGGVLSGPSGSVAGASGLPYAGENYLLLSPQASPFEAERLIAFFKARDLNFVAPVLPCTPPKLTAALEDARVTTVKSFTAMSFDLTRARPNKPTGTLSRVCGESEANEWGRVVWEGFGGAVVTPEYLALARHLAARKENKLYLLRDGSDAVSSALLHHTERSCGLYYFATPPEFRRRGHAKRLMEFLVNEAARDYKEMVLLATPEGLPLYSAFGYRALAEIPMRSDSEEL